MKYILLILTLTLNTFAFSKERIVIKGEYSKGYEKPFQLIWEVKKVSQYSYSFFLNNKLKAILYMDENFNILKIEKYLNYKGKVKKLSMENKFSIDYEIKNSLVPFGITLHNYSNKKSRFFYSLKTKHKFIIMDKIK